jgi:ribonuclease HI|tara:strand:+ start:4354 stop:4785 length:432 start_codon:yes stop_codon:yes gene_type:complete
MIKVYTDGACKGNPGPGGWGALIIYPSEEKEIYGGDSLTTNNRMELKAVIMALKEIDLGNEITIITDSSYVQKGISEWILKWKQNGWRSSNRKPVKNKDLWVDLDDISSKFIIKWEWIKGHSGDPGNERADYLANKGCNNLPI